MIKNTKKMKNIDLTEYLKQINDDYERTMNMIIFDKHLAYRNKELIPHNLVLPPKDDEIKEVPEYGLIALPRNKQSRDFTEVFKQFCFSSLLVKREVVASFSKLLSECNKVQNMDIFNFELNHVMRIEDYKHIQETAATQVFYQIKE